MLSPARGVISGLVTFVLMLSSPTMELVARAADPLEQARDMYNEGQAKFDTFDFDGAIELWTRALSKLPLTDEGFVIRSLVSYNIAAAQLEAYKLDGKVDRLRRVLLMLEKYEKDYIECFPEGPERDEELKKIADKRLEVQALLDAVNSEKSEAQSQPQPQSKAEGQSQRETEPMTTPSTTDDRSDGTDRGGRRPGRPLMAGGGIMLGLGLGGFGAMGAGMALGARARTDFEAATGPDDEQKRIDLLDDGKRANTIAIAGGVAGGVLAVTGAVLMAVGAKKNQRGSNDRRAMLKGAAGPEGFVVGLSGRF